MVRVGVGVLLGVTVGVLVAVTGDVGVPVGVAARGGVRCGAGGMVGERTAVKRKSRRNPAAMESPSPLTRIARYRRSERGCPLPANTAQVHAAMEPHILKCPSCTTDFRRRQARDQPVNRLSR